MEDGTGYVSVPLPVDAEEVAAHLKDTMLPEIQNMIQQQILTQQTADIKAIVSTAINDAVGQINETLMKEINTVKEENKKLKSENSELSTTVIDLKERVDKLELTADDSEQYSRRNSIRITGIPEDKDKAEDTDDIVMKLSGDLGVLLSPADIDRSHRVGVPRSGRNRAILVKFATYRARHSLYSKRMDLRKTDEWKNTFINEDLTSRRSKILFKARNYVRAGLLKSCYSSDGRIYMKDKSDKKHLIVRETDLQVFGTLPDPPMRAGFGRATLS